MKNTTPKPTKTIRTHIERSFIFASLIILIVTTVMGIYFNQKSLEEKRDSNLQKIHQILANLIIPELNISNTSEIRRLLQLASTPDEIYIVIDSSGIPLMPDYKTLDILKAAINLNAIHGCQSIPIGYKKINNSSFWITCSPLMRDDLLLGTKQSGILLTISKYKWFWYSSMMPEFIGMSLLTLILIIFWFRHILSRRLLRPTIILGSRIVEIAKSPLTASASIGDIGDAPNEIISIKNAFEQVLTNLQTEYQQRTESEKKAVLLDLAAQVAHDIRSPLAVMEMTLMSTVKFLPPDDVNIQKEALQSVRDIANNLLERYRLPLKSNKGLSNIFLSDDDSLLRPIFIASLVDQVISQKRQEWQNRSCTIEFITEKKTRYTCIQAVANDLKRVLSNLLNNSYEALQHKKNIVIKLESQNQFLKLRVIDFGKSIPQDKIASVLEGVSLKHCGKGMGLSSAKRIVENMRGTLDLKSDVGIGTEVTLTFTLIPNPLWFPQEIKINKYGTIIILDDDSSILVYGDSAFNHCMRHCYILLARRTFSNGIKRMLKLAMTLFF